MAIDFDNAFGLHANALVLRSRRAGMLAENLANADTPHYKARDMEFSTALDEARSQVEWRGIRTTHVRHMVDEQAPLPGVETKYRAPLQPSLDGNTVDAHMERSQFLQNALRFQASMEFLNARIRGIRAALRGE